MRSCDTIRVRVGFISFHHKRHYIYELTAFDAAHGIAESVVAPSRCQLSVRQAHGLAFHARRDLGGSAWRGASIERQENRNSLYSLGRKHQGRSRSSASWGTLSRGSEAYRG